MRALVVLALLCICGCEPILNPDYKGSVKPEKINGCVTRVTVEFPGSNNSVTACGKPQAEKLLTCLEAVTKDLQVAISQMEVKEPVVPKQGK